MSHSESIIPSTAPLAPEQVQALNNLLPSLTADQLIWMEGFISGLRAGKSGGTSTPAKPVELTVLFGSESGNAEALADLTAKKAEKLGFKPRVLSMGDIKPAKLKGTENLLVLVSTWGEGDPPENSVDFVEAFMGTKAPELKDTRFSVLSLGDTSYEHFCKIGKDFDARIEKLGGNRIFPRKDCDVDFDDDFNAWLDGTLTTLQEATKQISAPAGTTTAPVATGIVKYSRKNPFPAELTERVTLNGKGSAKETIHLEFDLAGSGLSYETGDALAVIPHNCPEVVEEILKVAKLDGDSSVTLKDGAFPLREALTKQLDITAISMPVLKRYNEIAKDKKLADILDPKNKKALQDYLYGRDIVDLITDFPAKDLTADALAGIMRKLPPRLYSIASSPKAHPDEVHLTVGVVRYDAHNRSRKGVCSTYLQDLIEEGDKTSVFVTANKHFKVPANPETPMIMVGPGTGIAPFRAFIEERKATQAKGKNWLFFGDQHYLTDFLYQTEWQDYLADGILNELDLAFSRDQKEKVYVQDRMREKAEKLFQWLEDGASFYVCGDATRMAVDVDKALHDIIQSQGSLSEEDAIAYVKKMKTDKLYLRDVY